jgi:biopolymer transport protein ExbD
MVRAAATVMPARPLKLWHDRTENQETRIEIVPLIDVVFCILIFFLLAAVSFSRQQALNLDLPKASTGTPQMREMLVVSLDELGQVYVEEQLVTRNQLAQALQNYHQFNPNGLMVLHASRNVTYNEVIQVLNMLKEVGGDRVALATLPGESESTQENLSPYSNDSAFPLENNWPNNSLPQQNLPSSTPNTGLNNSQVNPSNPYLPGVPAAPNTTTPNNN